MLQELQRLLASTSFALKSFKFDGSQNLQSKLPQASTYVIDLGSIPGGVTEIVGQILKLNPDAQMLVLADNLSQPSTFPLLQLGVRGLISHEMINEQLGRALEAVSTGGYWVPRTLLASFVESVVQRSRQIQNLKPATVEVSRREKDIIDGLLQNLSNKEIAGNLNISERTVKFHVSNLLTKFKVQRRADLILLWYQQGNQPNADNRPATAASRRIQ